AERIDAVWQRARAGQRPLGIALMDVDWFKAYNDRYGHPAGDRVLRAVGRVLGAHARGPLDMVARHGGEEFVCVWYDASLADVETTLAAIHADIAGLGIEHEGSHVPGKRLTLSIGLHYLYPQPGRAVTEALLRADQALYEAKASGRHTTVVRSPWATRGRRPCRPRRRSWKKPPSAEPPPRGRRPHARASGLRGSRV